MEQLQLHVTKRTDSGKKAAKKLRAAGLVPAVLYGKEQELTLLAVDEKAFLHSLRGVNYHSVLVKLNLENGQADDGPTVMIKAIQQHPVRGRLLNVDFHRISLTEEIATTVSIRLRGEPAGVRQGGILGQLLHEVHISCLPTRLPDHLEIEVSQLEINDSIHVRDLTVPEGVTITTPPDEVVVTLSPPVKEEVVEAAVAPAEGEEAAAEPEVIGKGKKTEEEAEEKK